MTQPLAPHWPLDLVIRKQVCGHKEWYSLQVPLLAWKFKKECYHLRYNPSQSSLWVVHLPTSYKEGCTRATKKLAKIWGHTVLFPFG